MLESLVLSKYKAAQRFLHEYAKLYWYVVDVYCVDESALPPMTEDYAMYLDFVITKFVTLPKKTIPVRFLESSVDVEENMLGNILTSGFAICVLDSILRENKVSLKVGDIISTHRVFEDIAELKSFSQFTKPAFVRIVQSIVPRTFMVANVNTLEWEIRLSDTDVVFRYQI